MKARMALQDHLEDPMQAAFETAVAQAVTGGVITQDQADTVLEEGWQMGAQGGGPPGGGPGNGPGGQGGPGAPPSGSSSGQFGAQGPTR